MAKTHHRRRHRRANRTRRGGVKHSKDSSPRAASAPPAAAAPRAATHADLADIFKRVNAIAAQATPQKISKPQTQSASIKKKIKYLNDVLAGKVKHSNKSAFKGPVVSDPQSARERQY
jgi:hypothetical protein